MFEIARTLPEDAPAIEDLLDAAFGPDRKQKTSYRYRQDVSPVAELSHVVRSDGGIVGSIAYWPVVVGEREVPALLLGPLAVEPGRKNQGIGRALVFATLDRAAALGHRLVLLVGDPDYYGRFGFTGAAVRGIRMPDENPERLQLRALDDRVLEEVSGDVRPWPRVEVGVGGTSR